MDRQDGQDRQDGKHLQGKLVLALIRQGLADARDYKSAVSSKILCIDVTKHAYLLL